MENKINLVDILKDCPEGMELHSTMFKNVKLKYVSSFNITYPICIETQSGNTHYLTKYGQAICIDDAKCVIFPKSGRNWEGFQKPFKEGDVIFGNNGACSYISIFKGYRDRYSFNYYVSYTSLGKFHINAYADSLNLRLATEKERQMLFEELKHRGYQWNEETKFLKKFIEPKFNVGDIIQDNEGYKVEITEVNLEDEYYMYISKIVNGIGGIDFKNQGEWDLVPNKFDISSLVPFESKVLVRDCESDIWKPAIFGGYIEERERYKYNVIGGLFYEYLIPYECNEYLCCKSDDCKPYYKTWNK